MKNLVRKFLFVGINAQINVEKLVFVIVLVIISASTDFVRTLVFYLALIATLRAITDANIESVSLSALKNVKLLFVSTDVKKNLKIAVIRV